jgi:aminomethyltransferase
MTGFAGYDMPLQFPLGVKQEHLHTRARAGLFDVSHMGQLRLHGKDVDRALEALMPSNIIALADGRQRYGLLTNDEGGIIDDLMVARHGDSLFLVVNAARREADLAQLRAHLPDTVELEELDDRALIALQGPEAAAVLSRFHADISDMRFMDNRPLDIEGMACIVSRSGYTGEDGFELSLPGDAAEAFVRRLLDCPEVEPVGLGARNSLRLEAGLCLYGNDIDMQTTPLEAGLKWAVSAVRRPGGEREGGYPGADRIGAQLTDDSWTRQRVGLRGEGRAPIRDGTPLFDAEGTAAGAVTSGVFGPSVDGPVAMGYVSRELTKPGTRLVAEVRGKHLPVVVAALPFVEPGYRRG